MPELPEVETIRQDLKSKILRKKIINIQVNQPKLVHGNQKSFVSTLRNNKFIDIQRIGKLIVISLADNKFLLIHLKMTGQLIYLLKNQLIAGGHNWPSVDILPNKYSHIILKFADNSQLFFNDLRQFGYWKIVDRREKSRVVSKFGIEPMHANFTPAGFADLFSARKTVLKSLLLNQKLIAGLGNIYVDEICHRAKILPQRRINTLSPREIKALYQACQYIIKKAIDKRGTTFSDYRDASGKKGNFVKYLKVYGRGQQTCLRCGQTIRKIKLNGRGTSFCPGCQN